MTTFTWSAWRYAAGMFGFLLITLRVGLTVTVGAMALLAGPSAMAGLSHRSTILWWPAAQAACSAVGGAAGALLVFRKRRPWLRLGSRGVEVAARGGELVFVPWPAVTSARISSRFFVGQLLVTSDPPDQVLCWSQDSWMLRRHLNNGPVTFKIDLGGMRGGRPAALAVRGPVDLRALLPQHPPSAVEDQLSL